MVRSSAHLVHARSSAQDVALLCDKPQHVASQSWDTAMRIKTNLKNKAMKENENVYMSCSLGSMAVTGHVTK